MDLRRDFPPRHWRGSAADATAVSPPLKDLGSDWLYLSEDSSSDWLLIRDSVSFMKGLSQHSSPPVSLLFSMTDTDMKESVCKTGTLNLYQRN